MKRSSHRNPRQLEVIARGLLISRHGILACRPKSRINCYLPGGHVEFGEPASLALEREMMEELGIAAKAGKFLGTHEQAFLQGGIQHHEINLYFKMTAPALSTAKVLISHEDHIEFFWLKSGEMAEVNLLPVVSRRMILRWKIREEIQFASDGLPVI